MITTPLTFLNLKESAYKKVKLMLIKLIICLIICKFVTTKQEV